jgi:hypothetical protein
MTLPEHGEGQNDKLRCSFDGCYFETKYRQTLATHVREKHQNLKRTQILKSEVLPAATDDANQEPML